jgi:hypothetical protein
VRRYLEVYIKTKTQRKPIKAQRLYLFGFYPVHPVKGFPQKIVYNSGVIFAAGC